MAGGFDEEGTSGRCMGFILLAALQPDDGQPPYGSWIDRGAASGPSLPSGHTSDLKGMVFSAAS
jgi:hypothetical protein